MTTTTKTKTLTTLTMLATLAFGSAQANAAERIQRGQVSVTGVAVKAVVAGPIAIRAYSGFSGGTVFAALAVTGTDADCKQPISGTSRVLGADQLVDYQVAAGQVACLETSTDRPFELLWRAQKNTPATPSPIAIARR